MSSVSSTSTNIFSITSDNNANWLASAAVSLQNQEDGGLISMLSSAAKNKPGSIASFLANSQKNASSMMSLTSTATTAATQLAIQQGDAIQQQRQQDALTKAMKDLEDSKNNVQAGATKLDSVIYFDDGSTIDTVNNIYTRPDGTQYDTVTGAVYVDPSSVVQLANGAYLNTQTNVMTMADGTQIDMITGLNVNQLNKDDGSSDTSGDGSDDGSGDSNGVDVVA